jgi:hypothetical protein
MVKDNMELYTAQSKWRQWKEDIEAGTSNKLWAGIAQFV